MEKIHEFECPACGGIMEFDAAAQSLLCPYCGTRMDIDASEPQMQSAQEQDQACPAPEESRETPAQAAPEAQTGEPQETADAPAQERWSAQETENMRIYACEACGAEIVGQVTQGAGCCPYCGSNILMKGQFAGDLKPDGVIPFQLDEKAAREAYKRHIKGKSLRPKAFRSENHIKKIQGLYVPFWLFDAQVHGDLTMSGEKTSSRISGDTTYTTHRVYDIRRAGDLTFKGVPTDGSQKMDDTLMEAIEPFDPTKILPFRSAYLAGFRADRYDVDEKQRQERALERIRISTSQKLQEQVSGYDSTGTPELDLKVRSIRSRYVLYPVWILSTKWRGKIFTFAMNGQTGKRVGDLPMDRGAFWLRLVGLAAAFSLVIYGLTAFVMSWA